MVPLDSIQRKAKLHEQKRFTVDIGFSLQQFRMLSVDLRLAWAPRSCEQIAASVKAPISDRDVATKAGVRKDASAELTILESFLGICICTLGVKKDSA
jgi:hypothetical protein